METTKEVNKINPAEFGIEEAKAKQISALFKPMLDKMEELEKEYNNIIKLDIEDPETTRQARELRLKFKAIRVETSKTHKEQKAFYLSGGRFVDALKNTQDFASKGLESKLNDIEAHQETKEAARIVELRNERVSILFEFGVEYPSLRVELMDSEAWEIYLIGVKVSFERAEIEADRIAKEREAAKIREALYQSRKADLMSLWSYLSDKEKAADFGELSEDVFNALIESAKTAKAKDEAEQKRIKAENVRLKAEAEKAEKAAEITRKKQEASLAFERLEKARVESELKEIADKKARDEEEQKTKIQAELNAVDKVKKELLIRDLEAIKIAYGFRSAKNKALFDKVKQQIDAVILAVSE